MSFVLRIEEFPRLGNTVSSVFNIKEKLKIQNFQEKKHYKDTILNSVIILKVFSYLESPWYLKALSKMSFLVISGISFFKLWEKRQNNMTKFEVCFVYNMYHDLNFKTNLSCQWEDTKYYNSLIESYFFKIDYNCVKRYDNFVNKLVYSALKCKLPIEILTTKDFINFIQEQREDIILIILEKFRLFCMKDIYKINDFLLQDRMRSIIDEIVFESVNTINKCGMYSDNSCYNTYGDLGMKTLKIYKEHEYTIRFPRLDKAILEIDDDFYLYNDEYDKFIEDLYEDYDHIDYSQDY